MIDAVREFFNIGKLLKEINAPLIVLIHKCQPPSKVSDLRPISYCIFIYMCISKLLAYRLKRCFPGLISTNQCAFMEG